MKKILYSWQEFDRDVQALALKIALSGWTPDYVVGVTRGGCIPAVMLSHTLKVPMWALKVSLRDDNEDCGNESNCWMAEDAFGWEQKEPKNILIVDDINDSGATFNWIRQDWQSSCLPDAPKWPSVWGNTTRFAVLFNNEASEFKQVSYTVNTINKMEDPSWIVYPWESYKSDI